MKDNTTDPIQDIIDLSDKMASGSDIKSIEEVPFKKNVIGAKLINRSNKIYTDADFAQDTLDKKSNRTLREKIAYKISVMMFCELLFIFALLAGIFIVPYVNAFVPTITMHLPPFILTISLITSAVFIFAILNNWQSRTATITKVIFISIITIVINLYPRSSWSFTIKEIELSQDIIKLILMVTETIFIKTTILAGFIITGLFKDSKRT